mmetsp:Transcript_121117/g.342685  ORF Transcript_121117/g.342685 Transcript_121117/m.342685 type:complete len:200 (-) Transcript_121117:469-1068(-)
MSRNHMQPRAVIARCNIEPTCFVGDVANSTVWIVGLKTGWAARLLREQVNALQGFLATLCCGWGGTTPFTAAFDAVSIGVGHSSSYTSHGNLQARQRVVQSPRPQRDVRPQLDVARPALVLHGPHHGRRVDGTLPCPLRRIRGRCLRPRVHRAARGRWGEPSRHEGFDGPVSSTARFRGRQLHVEGEEGPCEQVVSGIA